MRIMVKKLHKVAHNNMAVDIIIFILNSSEDDMKCAPNCNSQNILRFKYKLYACYDIFESCDSNNNFWKV